MITMDMLGKVRRMKMRDKLTISEISKRTGLARNTVAAGVRELSYRAQHPEEAVASRLRAPGGGRKRATDVDPDLMRALESLVEPATRGDPESPLRWTCKSTQKLADELTRQNHPVTDRTVAALLKKAVTHAVGRHSR